MPEITPTIIMDIHEPGEIESLLTEIGAKVERKNITPGDYIVSENCGVERKSVEDFVGSLFKGRLMDQLGRLSSSYEKSVLMVEGSMARTLRMMKNPRSFWGALLSIELDMGIAACFTLDKKQTSDALYTLAKRMQTTGRKTIEVRHKPKILSRTEQQIFLVSGLPGIGTELAAGLLEHFRTPRRIFTASQDEFMQVEGIGDIKAKKITELLDSAYERTRRQPSIERWEEDS